MKKAVVAVKKISEIKKAIATTPVKTFAEVMQSAKNKAQSSAKTVQKDFLTTFFNREQHNRGRTETSSSRSIDVFEILCLAMGIVGIVISWIPFVGFITPAVSLVGAYKTKRKNSKLRLAGILLSIVSITICVSIMVVLAVKPSVLGI